MSSELPIEERFRILVEITRASHFAWREAVQRQFPGVDPAAIVNVMWDITGVQTAEAYLKRIDPSKSLPEQIATSIVWSSQCMGEDAYVEKGDAPGEVYVRHDACPWHRWHERQTLLPEDRPGCDTWFDAMIRTINERLGTDVRFETESALPDGGPCCRRRIWEESQLDQATGDG